LTGLTTQHALPIVGDRIQFQQVILNLVVNGIDAMRDTPGQERIISIRTSRVDNFAELSVADRGAGIPESKLKEIFEPLFTSKAEGMGMGLSIARTIIEVHRGQISARQSGSRRRVVQDQTSSRPIVGDLRCQYRLVRLSLLGLKLTDRSVAKGPLFGGFCCKTLIETTRDP